MNTLRIVEVGQEVFVDDFRRTAGRYEWDDQQDRDDCFHEVFLLHGTPISRPCLEMPVRGAILMHAANGRQDVKSNCQEARRVSRSSCTSTAARRLRVAQKRLLCVHGTIPPVVIDHAASATSESTEKAGRQWVLGEVRSTASSARGRAGTTPRRRRIAHRASALGCQRLGTGAMSTGLPVDLGPGSRACHGRVRAAVGMRPPRGRHRRKPAAAERRSPE